jgi:hypothetical protein
MNMEDLHGDKMGIYCLSDYIEARSHVSAGKFSFDSLFREDRRCVFVSFQKSG